MRVAITDGKGNVWLDEAPLPEPNEYQCLCRILAAATCSGTDQKHIKNALPWKQEYPGVLGHESVGRVLQVGKRVRYIQPGDVFLRPTAVYNGEKLGGFGSLWGAFADYGLVTDTRARLEDEPNWTPPANMLTHQRRPAARLRAAPDATMLITLKEAASFVANAGVRLFKGVAVLGAGSVGICMCRFAKVFGASPVIAVARRDEQLAYARKIGADLTVNAATTDANAEVRRLNDGRGVDFVIDTTGDVRFLATVHPMLVPGGKIAPYATYEFGKAVKEFVDPSLLIAPPTAEHLAHPYLLDAVRLGLVTLSDYYSHRLPFARVKEGFDLLREKRAFKVVFEMEDAQ